MGLSDDRIFNFWLCMRKWVKCIVIDNVKVIDCCINEKKYYAWLIVLCFIIAFSSRLLFVLFCCLLIERSKLLMFPKMIWITIMNLQQWKDR